jgi:hypothetical protein
MIIVSRRMLFEGLSALGMVAAAGRGLCADIADVSSPPLRAFLKDPLLLATLYRLPVSKDYSEDGAAGANRGGYRYIEEQRQGAEWIVRGYAQGRDDWTAIGWHELDFGLHHQTRDGGFASADAFHSTSFFVEALARACLIDPAGATPPRVSGLSRATEWLMTPQVEAHGIPHNRPFTHRRYLLAAAFGQAAAVTGLEAFASRGRDWAREGLSLQRADGTNPERDGFDAGYQMVGALMALRYLPVCKDASLRVQLRHMLQTAVAAELRRMQPDGEISMADSTRINQEYSRSGTLKAVPYGEVMQALVYGAIAVPAPGWKDSAALIAQYSHWQR